MAAASKVKGIMFDMDNTLLRSKIDFAAMKADIFNYLVELNVLPADFSVHEHTSSTLMEHAKRLGSTDEVYQTMLRISAAHELAGMEGAGLEQGVEQLLQSLFGKHILIIITNNSYGAAFKALERTGIARYFDLIVGREQMPALKPSPSGFTYAMRQFSFISPNEWITVGDSWIDGRASTDSGIPFVSYRTRFDDMIVKGVKPVAKIDHIGDILKFLN